MKIATFRLLPLLPRLLVVKQRVLSRNRPLGSRLWLWEATLKRDLMVSLFGSFIGLGLWFILIGTATVQAAGTVTNCTGTGLAAP